MDPKVFALMAAVAGCGGLVIMFVAARIRNVVDALRVEREGLGGTQDIALWGTLTGCLWYVGWVIVAAWVLIFG